MPDFTFDGHAEMTYPSSRDAANLPVGTVQPGEIRDLDEPLDHWWRETTDEDRARWQAIQAERAAADTEEAEGAAPAPVTTAAAAPPAAAPQPAPPAVIPPAAQPFAPPAAATQEG